MNKMVTAAEAVKVVKSGDRIYLHSVAAVPHLLIDALMDRSSELKNVEIVSLHTEGEAPYVDEKYAGIFHHVALFAGPNVRKAIANGRADYLPVFLSEVPALFRKNVLPLDVVFIQVSPPDSHGFCTLGVSVDATKAAVESAKKIVAQINPNMPRTHGDGFIHVSKIDFMVESNNPIPESAPPVPTDEEEKIGKYCAGLIENGSCLQMGIGAIPNAVLHALSNHSDLGIHTEMFSDGVMNLVEKGVITGRKKKIHPGKIVSGFVMGTRKLYDFINDNPQVVLLDIAYVNDTAVIRRNPKVVAINSAIEVDLTGQICADSIGTMHFSGVGGQMDFVRGASLSEGGKPIIALPSTTSKGISRIAPSLKVGAGVVTTRAHVHYIVTEYGVADLYGKSLAQRAKALIEIAHPDHRESLERDARQLFKSY